MHRPLTMNWIDAEPVLNVPPAAELALARQAVEMRPQNRDVRLRLAMALLRNGEHAEAGGLYAEDRARAPDTFSAWLDYATCCAKTGALDEALELCRKGEAAGPDAAIASLRATVLDRLGRHGEARAARLQAVHLDPRRKPELVKLFMPLARHPDGSRLLAFCDALPEGHRNGVLDRAHRAIAYSRLGRRDEACALMDTDRHVAVVSFTPPPEFASLEAFNATLAAQILADPPLSPRRAGTAINYESSLSHHATVVALRDFIRTQIEIYIACLRSRGLDAVMPPVPSVGALRSASTVLRDTGRNGQHVHPRGYIASVYYVRVPGASTDGRGSLLLGCSDEYTGGHTPVWPTRAINPEPGWLVLFPAHLFHDVVPTGLKEARISLPCDLMDEADARFA